MFRTIECLDRFKKASYKRINYYKNVEMFIMIIHLIHMEKSCANAVLKQNIISVFVQKECVKNKN